MNLHQGTIAVVGGGGHAKVVIGLLKKLRCDVIGYTDQEDRGEILGVPHLGTDEALTDLLMDGTHYLAPGLGKVVASSFRRTLFHQMLSLGFKFPVIAAPQAVMNEDVIAGPGTVVCDGAILNVGSRIGSFCIINSNSTVEHDCHLADNVHVAPGATVSGGVTIGADCMIGAGSTIVHGVSLCSGTLVGAGATVTRDIESPGIYAGTPARRIG